MNEKVSKTSPNDITKKDSLVALLESLHDINERAKVITLPKKADDGSN